MPASCTGGFNWGLLHYVYSLRILQKRFLMRYYCLRRGQAQQHRGRIIVRGDDACAQNGAGESISCTSGAGTGKCGEEHFKSFHRVSKAEVSHRGFWTELRTYWNSVWTWEISLLDFCSMHIRCKLSNPPQLNWHNSKYQYSTVCL